MRLWTSCRPCRQGNWIREGQDRLQQDIKLILNAQQESTAGMPAQQQQIEQAMLQAMEAMRLDVQEGQDNIQQDMKLILNAQQESSAGMQVQL